MTSQIKQNNESKQNTQHVNCYNCEYLFITHDKNKRYGCKKFGFKGPHFPSISVFTTTGMKCAYFTLKKRLTNKGS